MTEHVKVALDLDTGRHQIIGEGITWTEANGYTIPNDWQAVTSHVSFTIPRAEMADAVRTTFELGRFEDDAHLPERVTA